MYDNSPIPMFLNISNHPSNKWGEAQRQAALALAPRIVDYPFPNIPPTASGEEVFVLAQEHLRLIEAQCGGLPERAMVQGEFCFAYHLVRLLRECDVCCYAATTERQKKTVVKEDGRTVEEAEFVFCRFRAY